MLERLHTKEVAYILLVLATIGVSGVFAYRAAIVYSVLLSPLAGEYWAFGLSIVVVIALTVAEFVAATQWSKLRRNVPVIALVVIHDAGGVFYTVFGVSNPFGKPLTLWLVAVGMTALSGLPFFFGHWMAELARYVPKEREERHHQWLSEFEQRMFRRAAEVHQKEMYSDNERLKELFTPPVIQQQIQAAQQRRLLALPKGNVFTGGSLHDMGNTTPMTTPIHNVSYDQPEDNIVESDRVQVTEVMPQKEENVVPFNRGRA